MKLKQLIEHFYCDEENLNGAVEYLQKRVPKWKDKSTEEASEELCKITSKFIKDNNEGLRIANSKQFECIKVYQGTIISITPMGSNGINIVNIDHSLIPNDYFVVTFYQANRKPD
jgi:hypothetical protein